jgi:hypothetical protein
MVSFYTVTLASRELRTLMIALQTPAMAFTTAIMQLPIDERTEPMAAKGCLVCLRGVL